MAAPPAAHPAFGGKSLENLPGNPYAVAAAIPSAPAAATAPAPAPPPQAEVDRSQRYKSWRKKYRKMRARFDGLQEENKRLFKDAFKLEATAKRLREEMDGLLDVCLDLNESPSLPPHLRFNIHDAHPRHPPAVDIPADISPEQANQAVLDYRHAVAQGSLPAVDLQIIRAEVDTKLAAQDVRSLDALLASVPSRPVAANPPSTLTPGDQEPGYLAAEQETAYLQQLDADLAEPLSNLGRPDSVPAGERAKHFADMTPRELERHLELRNPQSAHTWLAAHNKLGLGPAVAEAGIDDNESLASHEQTQAKPPRKRAKKSTLAKEVGERAVLLARDGAGVPGASPGAASIAGPEEEEGHWSGKDAGAKKRAGKGETDNAYHPKGGSGSSKKAGKRKRSGEDVGGSTMPGELVAESGSGGAKKVKLEVAGAGAGAGGVMPPQA
ncbi:hypothetical protein LTR53_004351 [Teratosphaeriaceae sp. CCFEE 6253]|nr:hypothetical protein LTR53_004351 [Teratosphaeriaceae sp. CCFEE 6253]